MRATVIRYGGAGLKPPDAESARALSRVGAEAARGRANSTTDITDPAQCATVATDDGPLAKSVLITDNFTTNTSTDDNLGMYCRQQKNPKKHNFFGSANVNAKFLNIIESFHMFDEHSSSVKFSSYSVETPWSAYERFFFFYCRFKIFQEGLACGFR